MDARVLPVETESFFQEYSAKIPVQKILDLYPLGHEQDVRNIADILSDML